MEAHNITGGEFSFSSLREMAKEFMFAMQGKVEVTGDELVSMAESVVEMANNAPDEETDIARHAGELSRVTYRARCGAIKRRNGPEEMIVSRIIDLASRIMASARYAMEQESNHD